MKTGVVLIHLETEKSISGFNQQNRLSFQSPVTSNCLQIFTKCIR